MVNFILDGAPRFGERALVSDSGIVGLLTAALLAQFPLERLVTLDRYPPRRQASLEAGAQVCLDPGDTGTAEQLHAPLPEGADLAYELSGAPAALDAAISAASYDSRVVIGSWYGSKRASLDLGGRFHRSRIRLISSQVSTLAPELDRSLDESAASEPPGRCCAACAPPSGLPSASRWKLPRRLTGCWTRNRSGRSRWYLTSKGELEAEI